MAISVDGRTTGSQGDVSWVEESDIERMDQVMRECGVMIMGSNTYNDFGDDLPNEEALQVVMTSQELLLNKKQENVNFTNQTPTEVLKMIEEKGFSSVLLAGGEQLNTAFAKDGLIDEVRIIIKPLVLGIGKQLFSQLNERLALKLENITRLHNGSVEMQYSVVN
jgi:dihydrofolate reductase